MKEPFNLEDRPRQHPFQVPEGYFDELPQRIQQRVRQQATVPGWLQWVQSQRLALATVACAVLVVLGFLFVQRPESRQAAVLIQDLSQTEIIAYLVASPLAFDDADLARFATIEHYLPATSLQVQPQDLDDQIEYETIEEYIL